MIDRMSPAVSMPMPSGGPLKSTPIPGTAAKVSTSQGCR